MAFKGKLHRGSSPHARGTLLIQLALQRMGRFIPACAGNAGQPVIQLQDASVHPRMRGERPSSWEDGTVWAGSSPHARGTPKNGQHAGQDERFIPACAGNARWPAGCSSGTPVHPRMRGERFITIILQLDFHGSSPHARGTHMGDIEAMTYMRFIPACAGNASSPGDAGAAGAVHPRMRGERLTRHNARQRAHGSSPHARGTQPEPICQTGRLRFIPACAGNAPPCSSPRTPMPVHPRMRGERRIRSQTLASLFGSSPHARGTLLYKLLGRPQLRFIPACAGNAPPLHPGRQKVPVHPRMRGERGWPTQSTSPLCGSSPHARGTRCRLGPVADTGRFIPACAGNACRALAEGGSPPVHPRMRGERDQSRDVSWFPLGSSPHARGTRRFSVLALSVLRFIPACAGNAIRRLLSNLSTTVHPRMRGERFDRRGVVVKTHGSSPHARGTRR